MNFDVGSCTSGSAFSCLKVFGIGPAGDLCWFWPTVLSCQRFCLSNNAQFASQRHCARQSGPHRRILQPTTFGFPTVAPGRKRRPKQGRMRCIHDFVRHPWRLWQSSSEPCNTVTPPTLPAFSAAGPCGSVGLALLPTAACLISSAACTRSACAS